VCAREQISGVSVFQQTSNPQTFGSTIDVPSFPHSFLSFPLPSIFFPSFPGLFFEKNFSPNQNQIAIDF
jgi:hypothetical protein